MEYVDEPLSLRDNNEITRRVELFEPQVQNVQSFPDNFRLLFDAPRRNMAYQNYNSTQISKGVRAMQKCKLYVVMRAF